MNIHFVSMYAVKKDVARSLHGIGYVPSDSYLSTSGIGWIWNKRWLQLFQAKLLDTLQSSRRIFNTFPTERCGQVEFG